MPEDPQNTECQPENPDAVARQDEEAPPHGTANSGDADKVMDLRNALKETSEKYSHRARWHLRRGLFGLVFGFVLTVVLPALFIVIDTYVQIWRDEHLPPADFAQTKARIDDFSAESDKILNDARRRLAEAEQQRFGSLMFELTDSPAPKNRPRNRTFYCDSIEGFSGRRRGNEYWKDGTADLYWRGQLGQPNAEVVARISRPETADCQELSLNIPQNDEFESLIDFEDAGLWGDYLVVLGVSKARAATRHSLRAFACPVSRANRANPADCSELTAEGGYGRFQDPYVWAGSLGEKAHLVIDFTNSFDVVELSIQNGTMRRLDVNSQDIELDNVFVKGPDIYFIGYGNGNPLGRAKTDDLTQDIVWSFVRAPSANAASRNELNRSRYNVLDIARVTDEGSLLILWATEDGRSAALSLEDGAEPLKLTFSDSASEFNEIRKIDVTAGRNADRFISLGASRDSYSGTTDYFVARFDEVRALLTGTPVVVPAAEAGTTGRELLEQPIFRPVAPWYETAAIVPLRDVELFARSRAISAGLGPVLNAAVTVSDIKSSVEDLEKQFETAKKKSDASDQTIEQWSKIAARIIVISLILYYVQLEVSLYRYDSRLAGHYRARLLALDYLIAAGAPINDEGLANFYSAIVAIDAKDISSKDPPSLPADKLVELLRDFLSLKREKSGKDKPPGA